MPGESTLSVSVLGASPFRVDEAPSGFDPRGIEGARLEVSAGQVVAAFGLGRLVIGFDEEHVGTLGAGAWPGVSQGLSAVTHHRDAGPGIRRYRFAVAPIYSAMHVID